MERLVEYHRTPPAIVDRPGAARLRVGPGEVRFEGVRFHYRGHDAPPVLRGDQRTLDL